MMSEAKWKKFFDLLILITEGDKPFTDKKRDVEDEAQEYGDDAVSALDEFNSWFQE